MTQKFAPQVWTSICDGCGLERETGSPAHPTDWAKLRLERKAFDWQGIPVADANIERDFCPDCTIKLVDALNKVGWELRNG